MVDVDIEEVVRFCQNFEKEYINPSLETVSNFKKVAYNIDSSLRGTAFATRSSERILAMANQLQKILDQGEQRILELERKASDDLERGREFTR